MGSTGLEAACPNLRAKLIDSFQKVTAIGICFGRAHGISAFALKPPEQ